jgi:hypothetical protein
MRGRKVAEVVVEHGGMVWLWQHCIGMDALRSAALQLQGTIKTLHSFTFSPLGLADGWPHLLFSSILF